MEQSILFEAVVKAVAIDDETIKALGLEGKRLVDGPVADHDRDHENEMLGREGVWKGLQTFNKMGRHVDWEHQYRKTLDAKYLIGKGAHIYKGSDQTPRLTTELYENNPFADSAWGLLKSNGELGYSVEGKATARDPKDPGHITDMHIYRVTLATSPMGYGSRVQPILSTLKALEMGEHTVAKGWVETARLDDALADIADANLRMPPIRLVQEVLLKSYTTGSSIIGIGGDEGTTGPLRPQEFVADHIVQPLSRTTPRKRKKPTISEALISKGVPVSYSQKLESLGYTEEQIYMTWEKLNRYAPRRGN